MKPAIIIDLNKIKLSNTNNKFNDLIKIQDIGDNTANNIDNYSFTAAIRVLPSCPVIDNIAQLTVVNTGANAAIVSNAAVTVRSI